MLNNPINPQSAPLTVILISFFVIFAEMFCRNLTAYLVVSIGANAIYHIPETEPLLLSPLTRVFTGVSKHRGGMQHKYSDRQPQKD